MASALLILTLLTTSVIGGTFAKYVSEGSVSDTARVAKWGVEIKTSGTLYSDAYAIANAADDTKSNIPVTWDSNAAADKITVAAKESKDNIVAPGTKSYGHGLSFSISGTPEVAVKVMATIKAEDIYLAAGTYGVLVKAADVDDALSLQKLLDANLASDSTDATKKYNVFLKTTDASSNDSYTRVTSTTDFNVANKSNYYILTNEVTVDKKYYPVQYKLEGETTDTNAKTAIAVANALADKIKSGTSDDNATDFKTTLSAVSDVYAANTNLATAGPKFGNEKLSWEWAYEDSDESKKDNTNAKDTLLGDLIAIRAANTATPTETVDYVVVGIATDTTTGNETITALEVQTAADDYTVKKGNDVVANLRTLFNITLKVEQVD